MCENKTESELQKKLWKVIAIVLLVVIGSILSGLALIALWGWFIIPIFGFRALLLPEAIGIGMVASFLTHPTPIANVEKSYLMEYVFTATIFRPVIAYFIGWIVQLFL